MAEAAEHDIPPAPQRYSEAARAALRHRVECTDPRRPVNLP